ncbi:Elongator complex protein 4 [Gorgonomyces haynaldii]|nr:Elongator complex protein 4 [Gorgonomyces haynaldii]
MSFKPRKKQEHPKGTKISTTNGQILTSTGVASLDELLGGGLPLSSLILLKEDRFTGYALVLLRYFLAQGVAHGHSVALATMDIEAEAMMQELMGIVENKTESSVEEDADYVPAMPGVRGSVGRSMGRLREADDKMHIAWRYQHLPQFTTQLSLSQRDTAYCHTFDLTKRMQQQYLENVPVSLNDDKNLSKNILETLLDRFKQMLQDPRHIQGQGKSMLRIGLHSICSSGWEQVKKEEWAKFLNELKILMRERHCVCMVTVPAHLYGDFHGLKSDPMIRQLEHIADSVLEIESFAGSPHPVNEQYTSDYHGLIHPHKLFRQYSYHHTTRLSNVELHSLGFKLRRKRFTVETFHLPPELGEPTKTPSLDF